MTVVLITSSEIHIKNETLSLFSLSFFFFKVAALEKMKGRVCVWGGEERDYKWPGNTHAVVSPHPAPPTPGSNHRLRD